MFHPGRHARKKVNGRHKNFVFSIRMWHLYGGKITKHLVGRREMTHSIFVFYYLGGRSSRVFPSDISETDKHRKQIRYINGIQMLFAQIGSTHNSAANVQFVKFERK